MKWYETNYVNRRDWILDNLEYLGLDDKQVLIVLLIDFLNDKNIPISLELLEKKSGLSKEEVDQQISILCAKKYLLIKASAKHIRFILDGLFETDVAKEERVLDSSLFETFENEFGRPLSNNEMTKISEWNSVMDKKLILYALREASAYQHLSFPYIEKILTTWQEKKYSASDIETGKR